MSGWVVDARVAVQWFFPELHSDAARRLLANHQPLRAPDLIGAALGNVLWKQWRRQALTAEAGVNILQEFRRFPMVRVPCANLLVAAWNLATELERPVYESLYVTLAERLDGGLVTADQPFYTALQASRLADRVVWIDAIH